MNSQNFVIGRNLISLDRNDIPINSLGVVQSTTRGLFMTNSTLASSGNQQISPASYWSAQGWKTDATASSQPVDFRAYNLPIEGASAPTGQWLLQSSINSGGFSTRLRVNTNSIESVFSSTGLQINGGGLSFTSNAPISQTITVPTSLTFSTVGVPNQNTFSFNPASGYSGTSGAGYTFLINSGSGFAPTSGTAEYDLLRLTPTINQTGGASGITRGIHIDSTITAAADFRAIDIENGSSLSTIISSGLLFAQGDSSLFEFPRLRLLDSDTGSSFTVDRTDLDSRITYGSSGDRILLFSDTGILSLTTVLLTESIDFDPVPTPGNAHIGITAPDPRITLADSLGSIIDVYNTSNELIVDHNSVNKFSINQTSVQITESLGVGVTPTARIHISAGTASPSTSPLKFNAGTNLTTEENGAVEFDGTELYLTTGGVRKFILQSDMPSTVGDIVVGDGTHYTNLNIGATDSILQSNGTSPVWGAIVDSGTYTPTLTSVANVDSSSPLLFRYLRIGNVVHVSGTITVDPTAASTTQIGISIPVSSNFAGPSDAGGTAHAHEIGDSGSIYSDPTNDRVQLDFISSDTDSNIWTLIFSYLII